MAVQPLAGEQTDEAAITGIGSGPGGATVFQLDRALKWTHLGEVVAVPGDEAGRTVSRARPQH